MRCGMKSRRMFVLNISYIIVSFDVLVMKQICC